MFFDDLTEKVPMLQKGHPYFWLEDILLNVILNDKAVHDAAHVKQLLKWGCDPTKSTLLARRFDENGIKFSDRMYHLTLHLKYWKEEGMHMAYVKQFEEQSGKNLDDLTTPSIGLKETKE
jgi:hypothetical protein